MRVPRPLAWLHIPKCGTSFANVLYHHRRICPWMPKDAFLRTGDQWTSFVKQHSLDDNCPGSLERNFRGDHQGIGLDYWRIGGENIFAFFRQPEQRLISGYVDKQKDLPIKLGQVSLMDYARTMQGCATRMLTRGLMPCGDVLGNPSPAEVYLAVARVQELGFVGLTDEWDLSVCLFYTMYGGRCTDLAFRNVRPGKGRNSTSEAYDSNLYLPGFKDAFDGKVYEKAKEVFWDRVARYGVNRSSCEETCAAAVKLRPFSVRAREPRTAFQRLDVDSRAVYRYDWPGRFSYEQD